MARTILFRPLLLLAGSIVFATPAGARVGPEIAYSINNEIYLINPAGSGKVRIYRAKGSGFINSVSLKKAGGSIAFVDNWILKFMSYTATGAQVGTIYSLPGCYRQADVQYHPDGNSVIYRELCDGTNYIRQVAIPDANNPQPTPQTLFANADIIDLGGFDGTGQSFVYSVTNATAWQVRRHFMNGDDVIVTSKAASGPQLRSPSITHDGTRIVASHWHDSTGPAGTNYTSEYDVASGNTFSPNFITGQRADYASDDARIIFRVTEGRTTYLHYREQSGRATRVTSSTAYLAFHDIDWGD